MNKKLIISVLYSFSVIFLSYIWRNKTPITRNLQFPIIFDIVTFIICFVIMFGFSELFRNKEIKGDEKKDE
jgi:hypothetical protein